MAFKTFTKSEVVLKGTTGKNTVRLFRIWRIGFAFTWNFKKTKRLR